MEFQAIYNIRDKVKPMLDAKGVVYTELKPPYDFEFAMFEKVINAGKPNEHKGYSWRGGRCRWGTTHKLQIMEKHCKGAIEYVGIAYDEQKRLQKERKGNKVFPLADLRMTEADCLAYCYQQGFNWMEDGIDLYSILDRVSCWCCANKNLKELKNIYRYLPNYWNRLKMLQDKTDRPFKGIGKSVYELEKRFEGEIQNEMLELW